jgi:IrrE N-terminal-like domain
MFERGFKTWCEKLSLEMRGGLGLRPIDPLPARELAKHLGTAVMTTAEFPTLTRESQGVLECDDAWSAVTLEANGRKLVILKASNSLGRQSSDLMHEISHHLLDHRPTEVDVSKEGLLMLHSYSRTDEAQADWLSACLLLPRPALMHIKTRLRDEGAAAQVYAVSIAMLRYRLDVSGINYQASRRKKTA